MIFTAPPHSRQVAMSISPKAPTSGEHPLETGPPGAYFCCAQLIDARRSAGFVPGPPRSLWVCFPSPVWPGDDAGNVIDPRPSTRDGWTHARVVVVRCAGCTQARCTRPVVVGGGTRDLLSGRLDAANIMSASLRCQVCCVIRGWRESGRRRNDAETSGNSVSQRRTLIRQDTIAGGGSGRKTPESVCDSSDTDPSGPGIRQACRCLGPSCDRSGSTA